MFPLLILVSDFSVPFNIDKKKEKYSLTSKQSKICSKNGDIMH